MADINESHYVQRSPVTFDPTLEMKTIMLGQNISRAAKIDLLPYASSEFLLMPYYVEKLTGTSSVK